MKSIKPGRGPSGMSFIGSIIAVIFGIFWTIMAASFTADSSFGLMENSPFGVVGAIFPLFGVLFVIAGIASAIYNYKNATGKNRYSILDIADSKEEGDPSDNWIKKDNEINEIKHPEPSDSEVNFCPYCGVQLKNGFVYCTKCGKAIQ